jgi:hypothetical protein
MAPAGTGVRTCFIVQTFLHDRVATTGEGGVLVIYDHGGGALGTTGVAGAESVDHIGRVTVVEIAEPGRFVHRRDAVGEPCYVLLRELANQDPGRRREYGTARHPGPKEQNADSCVARGIGADRAVGLI